MSSRLADLSKSFSRHLRAEGRADRTVTIYGQAIRFYADWLTAQGRPATVEELTRAGIREWLAQLTDAGMQPSTVKTRYRGLFRFCRWLVEEDELEANPMAGLSPPEPKATPVPVFDDTELTALLKAVSGKTFEDRRDEAILRVLLDTGLRVSELVGLTVPIRDERGRLVGGVDLDDAAALVHGKGGKARLVYFSSRTVRALDRYLRVRSRHRHAHLDALLLGQRGAMSADGVRERLYRIGEVAGVADVHPHRFRHTWAHDYLMSGGQERDLKRLAGWSSDVMLERYGASAADARARAAVQRLKRGDRV